MVESHSLKPVIISSQANDLVVSRLINGAMRTFSNAGIAEKEVTVLRVPGALEIPVVLKKAAASGLFTNFVVLGAVIKGKTDHYDHVARMANDGVMSVMLEHSLALGNGILTVHSLEHALERADGPCGNLGADAASASLTLLTTFLALEQSKRTLR